MRSSLPTLKEVNCCLHHAQERVAALENSSAVTLVAGEYEVADPNIKATSLVFLSRQEGAGTLGHLEAVVSDGVGFNIVSSSNTETSIIAYVVHY